MPGDACYETATEIRIITMFFDRDAKKPIVKYRPDDNAAYIRFSSAKVIESAEVSPDVVFDFDAEGPSSAPNCSTRGRSSRRPC